MTPTPSWTDVETPWLLEAGGTPLVISGRVHLGATRPFVERFACVDMRRDELVDLSMGDQERGEAYLLKVAARMWRTP